MTALAGSLLERAVEPLDSARTALYRLAFRVPPLAAVVKKRDRRVAFVATAHALVAFVLTLTIPSFLIAVGPIFLGVAHVVADVRYLVLRRGLPKLWLGLIAVACVVLIALRVSQELGANPVAIARGEYAVVGAWVALGLLLGGSSSGRWGRVGLGLALVAAFGLVALSDPYLVRIVFTHVHNLVALALWLALFRTRLRAVAIPLVVMALATLVLASGRTYFITERFGALQLFGLHVLAASDWLAPGLPFYGAVGLTLSFAFLQSVHYSTWLLVIPQEDVPGPGTATFRRFARALGREFGGAGVALIVLGTLAVAAGAFFDLARARNLYLSLAMFHGYVELALGAYFFARGGFAPASAALRPAVAAAAA